MATIDEGIEILTRLPAGRRNEQGKSPEGSINQKVEQQLIEFAEQARAFYRGTGEEEKRNPVFVKSVVKPQINPPSRAGGILLDRPFRY